MDDKAIQQFWSKVDKSGECWIWLGSKTQGGYGLFRFSGKRAYAHRFTYELTHGSIPDGLHICHTCDNPSCCNPAHLWAGTPVDNMADRDRKGRGVWASGANQELRERISASAKAQWADPEKRAKIVAARTIANQRAAQKPRTHPRRPQKPSPPRKKWTAEQRARHSERMKQRMSDPDIRARISATLKGRKRKAA